ncbi:MAG: hypothetical protein F7B95_04105 [Desulfurococcales archaeon]|nr:hypothetical protein [Desulfurococcales archaeon]
MGRLNVIFKCNVDEASCERVRSTITNLLSAIGFNVDREIVIQIGPGPCTGPCVIYDPHADESVVLLETLSSIIMMALGAELARLGRECKLYIVDGVSVAAALAILKSMMPEVYNRAGDKLKPADPSLVKDRFGDLVVSGPGIIKPSQAGGTEEGMKALLKAVELALEYLNNVSYRLASQKIVTEELGLALPEKLQWRDLSSIIASIC